MHPLEPFVCPTKKLVEDTQAISSKGERHDTLVAMGFFGGATATQVLGKHGGVVGQPLKGAPSQLGRSRPRKIPTRPLCASRN